MRGEGSLGCAWGCRAVVPGRLHAPAASKALSLCEGRPEPAEPRRAPQSPAEPRRAPQSRAEPDRARQCVAAVGLWGGGEPSEAGGQAAAAVHTLRRQLELREAVRVARLPPAHARLHLRGARLRRSAERGHAHVCRLFPRSRRLLPRLRRIVTRLGRLVSGRRHLGARGRRLVRHAPNRHLRRSGGRDSLLAAGGGCLGSAGGGPPRPRP